MSQVAVSLFDESGNMLRPWAERGWRCFNLDLLNSPRVEDFRGGGQMEWINADMRDPAIYRLVRSLSPRFMSAFPPCTDLAGSGALHWRGKERDNWALLEALDLVLIANDLMQEAGCAGFIENPIGRLATYWREADFIFNPHEYGGYLPEDDVHPRWPKYFPPRDAYTKKTCIWAVGGFNIPAKKAVEPVWVYDKKGNRSSPIWKMLGGKSAKTKQIRSETPRGWCKAVCEANCD